jgi:hypothetical protein
MGEKGSIRRMCSPLVVGLLFMLAGWSVIRLDERPPPNCDFGCVMGEIGWQDYLYPLLFSAGVVAFCVFVIRVMYRAFTALSSLRDLWR